MGPSEPHCRGLSLDVTGSAALPRTNDPAISMSAVDLEDYRVQHPSLRFAACRYDVARPLWGNKWCLGAWTDQHSKATLSACQGSSASVRNACEAITGWQDTDEGIVLAAVAIQAAFAAVFDDEQRWMLARRPVRRRLRPHRSDRRIARAALWATPAPYQAADRQRHRCRRRPCDHHLRCEPDRATPALRRPTSRLSLPRDGREPASTSKRRSGRRPRRVT